MSHDTIYTVWTRMLGRCYNKNNAKWHRYGGRAHNPITVCPAWHTFENFYADMGATYDPKLQIDRIDNDKGYYKENCRWVDCKTNNRNRSTARMLTARGRTQSVVEWAEEVGLGYHTLLARIRKGIDPETALFTPVSPIGRSETPQ